MHRDRKPTQVHRDSEPTQVRRDPKPTQVRRDPKPTQVRQNPSPTQVGRDTKPRFFIMSLKSDKSDKMKMMMRIFKAIKLDPSDCIGDRIQTYSGHIIPKPFVLSSEHSELKNCRRDFMMVSFHQIHFC